MTDDQSRALEFLDAYLQGTRRRQSSFAALKGYAGVGKTWLIAYWLERLLEKRPGLRIVVTAPTNKAVDVLRSKAGHLKVDFRTLDSYLGFKVKRNDDWQMERSRRDKPEEDAPDLVIVDEGSMVKPEYHKELTWRRVPVLYVLDPAQLQPVGEEGMPAAEVELQCMMTEVVRQQAGNPIIELATMLRDRVNDGGMFTLPDVRAFAKEGDRRIAFTHLANVHDWAQGAIAKGLDQRILCFTNAAVHANNHAMHARLYPDAPLFGEGELVLVNEAFEYDDDTMLLNGEVLRVVSCTEVAEVVDGVRTFEVKALRLANSLQVDGDTVGRELTMLVPLDPEQAMRVHRVLTDEIFDARRKNADTSVLNELFTKRRPLNKLAPLRHSYSCTVHKSQGSTYDVAFVDFSDIYRSREMRARLLYVAATRPSQFLVIAHGGNR